VFSIETLKSCHIEALNEKWHWSGNYCWFFSSSNYGTIWSIKFKVWSLQGHMFHTPLSIPTKNKYYFLCVGVSQFELWTARISQAHRSLYNSFLCFRSKRVADSTLKSPMYKFQGMSSWMVAVNWNFKVLWQKLDPFQFQSTLATEVFASMTQVKQIKLLNIAITKN